MKLFSQYKGLRKENYMLFFGRIVTNLGSMVWSMLTLIMTQKMGMSAGDTAVVMLIFSLLMVPVNYIGGRMADRYNKKMCIVYCDIVSIVCFIICGIMHLSMISIGIIMVAAMFQNMERALYDALIADITTTENREKAYSLQYLGANIGLVASPTIAGFLFKNMLWLAFIISGLAIASSTVLIFFKLNDIEPVNENTGIADYQKSEKNESLLSVLKSNKVVMFYIAIMGMFSFTYTQYSYLMPLDLGRIHGDNGALLYGTMTSINCIIVVVFTPVITSCFMRISEIGKSLIGEALQIVGYGVFMVFINNIAVYYLSMVLFTWGEIFVSISATPYLSKRTPSSHRGRINGVNAVVMAVMTGAGQLAAGCVYDISGSMEAWIMTEIVGLASIFFCFILAGKDKKEYHKLYQDV